MIKYVFSFFMLLTFSSVFSQTKEKIMEKRARDMHTAVTSDNKDVWKKFIEENYSERLIKARGMDKILSMWQKLYQDLTGSKIVSVTPTNDGTEMIVKRDDDGQKLTFIFSPEAVSPYKIDRMAVEMGDRNMGGPSPGGDPSEQLMNQLLQAVAKGQTKDVDDFVQANVDQKVVKDLTKVKSDIYSLLKDFKKHQIMSANIMGADVEYIIESDATHKAKKIVLTVNGNTQVTAVRITDFTP